MGRPPAFVFVVRHGNRLDAANKQWHLSSPTPYDPPLTYGGWQQSKTVGARIADVLREREAEDNARLGPPSAASDGTKSKKRRRYKVIIHSSPFLRCTQSSIAISAGLASNPSLPSAVDNDAQARQARINQSSSFSNPAPTRTRPTISAESVSSGPSQPAHIEKSILRLDAFLGEWMSPDYFEHITPPPKSSLMLMTAKAELLRREDYSRYPHFNTRTIASPPSQLWGAGIDRPASRSEDTGLDAMGYLGDALPSQNGSSNQQGRHVSFSGPSVAVGYQAPIPTFALSPSESIPSGYVAHARDACVDFDYQWDSTRDSLGWGDGGDLPEEWANMHQRFRKGLKRLVEWYATADDPGEMVTRVRTSPHGTPALRLNDTDPGCAIEDEEDDAETENVVILVSHGAGCNALVGGLTNQPVLADVPMASITMAKRRHEFDDSNNAVDNSALVSLDDAFGRKRLSVPDLYELKMFAATEHLRSEPPSRRTSNAGVHTRSGSSSSSRGFGGFLGQTTTVARSNSTNASLGSMRRPSYNPTLSLRTPNTGTNARGGITVGSGATSFSQSYQPQRNISWGLWTPKQDVDEADEDLPMTLDFSYEKTAKQSAEPTPPKSPEEPKRNGHPPDSPPQEKAEESKSMPTLTAESAPEDEDESDEFPPSMESSGSGLWGSPRPPGEADRLRDFTWQKRRWTVNER